MKKNTLDTEFFLVKADKMFKGYYPKFQMLPRYISLFFFSETDNINT